MSFFFDGFLILSLRYPDGFYFYFCILDTVLYIGLALRHIFGRQCFVGSIIAGPNVAKKPYPLRYDNA